MQLRVEAAIDEHIARGTSRPCRDRKAAVALASACRRNDAGGCGRGGRASARGTRGSGTDGRAPTSRAARQRHGRGAPTQRPRSRAPPGRPASRKQASPLPGPARSAQRARLQASHPDRACHGQVPAGPGDPEGPHYERRSTGVQCSLASRFAPARASLPGRARLPREQGPWPTPTALARSTTSPPA